ncbi:hypothetical protein CHS0354_000555 [Potamilus streckersoni]|uniref:Gfo/Idh/MocA family oxidoreductase n=1 Tax=Potamilus streckersoni TaxID=2493646 RepID=A0AAE0W918_9BIVA|nr:hypothetical protein CHS0354_000555 [Potamilus streckersoni]
MDRLKVGIIGAGNIAQVHHIPILNKLPNATLHAICDTDVRRAKLISDKYNVKNVFTSHQDMLGLPDLDAVIVSTPTNTHKAIAIDSILAKKFCFIEKPLARTADEAKEILNVVTREKGHVMVGMNQRFRSDALVLKNFLQHGEIGDVFFIKCGWLQKDPVDVQWKTQKNVSGGGVFLDLGIMVLDLALWLLDFPPPKSVSASNFTRTESSKHSHIEDFSVVLLRLKTGQSISIETSWNFEVGTDLLFCNTYGRNGFARVYPLTFHKKLNDKLVNVTPERMGCSSEVPNGISSYYFYANVNVTQNETIKSFYWTYNNKRLSGYIASIKEGLFLNISTTEVLLNGKTGDEIAFVITPFEYPASNIQSFDLGSSAKMYGYYITNTLDTLKTTSGTLSVDFSERNANLLSGTFSFEAIPKNPSGTTPKANVTNVKITSGNFKIPVTLFETP